ncbi:RGS domain-containing protein [Ilyonectria destructans]|nr:RGS domain-containing protein [Ilyonectria destructans]
MISDDYRLSAFLRDRRLSVGSDSSANTVKAAPSSPRAKRVEPVSVREGSTKADSLVEPSSWQTFDTIIPDNDSVDLYKADKRRPTLFEVLSRRTTKPYSLFEFYIYMRDVQHALDYLDFWLDVAQHMSLCRHYLRELRRSVLVDELELVDSSNHETMQSSDDDAKSRAGSKAASESNPVVARQDIRASAEKILYTFLLPGAEREIVLPGYITQDVTSAMEEDGRDDPDVFDMAKDYVFQAMERDAFPGFLNLSRPLFRIFRRSDVLGSLVNRLSGVSPGPEVVQSLYDGGHGMQRIPPQQLFEALGTGKPPQV